MASPSYRERRARVETYFDRTAAEAWKRLTSDAPVSGIRATVRAGRDRMRQTLLDWLPADLTGRRVLDAGCGTGLLAIEAARRGAQVVAVDLASALIEQARARLSAEPSAARIEFLVGDMLDPGRGTFDHIVAMDSLIHYEPADALTLIEGFAAQCATSVLFTFAPRTPALALMHAVGQWFPRGDRSPAIVPIGARRLRANLAAAPGLAHWRVGRDQRIAHGFYTSHALELVPAAGAAARDAQ